MTTEETVSTVTRKGQVTIPAEFRKSHNIRKGSKVIFLSRKSGELTLTPVANLEDMAGVDSRRTSYKKAVKKLDRMRYRGDIDSLLKIKSLRSGFSKTSEMVDKLLAQALTER
jgi:AbrB family looped-hinge helix DNA binding protein